MTHYDFDSILATAHDIGEGWRKNEIKLVEGDTAYNPGSTKWNFAGPGVVTYFIHPSGWTYRTTDNIRSQRI